MNLTDMTHFWSHDIAIWLYLKPKLEKLEMHGQKKRAFDIVQVCIHVIKRLKAIALHLSFGLAIPLEHMWLHSATL